MHGRIEVFKILLLSCCKTGWFGIRASDSRQSKLCPESPAYRPPINNLKSSHNHCCKVCLESAAFEKRFQALSTYVHVRAPLQQAGQLNTCESFVAFNVNSMKILSFAFSRFLKRNIARNTLHSGAVAWSCGLGMLALSFAVWKPWFWCSFYQECS